MEKRNVDGKEQGLHEETELGKPIRNNMGSIEVIDVDRVVGEVVDTCVGTQDDRMAQWKVKCSILSQETTMESC